MNINLDTQLKQIDGTPIEGAYLADLAIQALLADYQSERGAITGDEKAKRYQLAARIQERDKTQPVALSVEEVVLLKKLIGEAYQPLFVGQAYAILEG